MGSHQHVGHGYKPRQHVVVYDMSRKIFKEEIPFLLVHVQTRRADFPRLDTAK